MFAKYYSDSLMEFYPKSILLYQKYLARSALHKPLTEEQILTELATLFSGWSPYTLHDQMESVVSKMMFIVQ